MGSERNQRDLGSALWLLLSRCLTLDKSHVSDLQMSSPSSLPSAFVCLWGPFLTPSPLRTKTSFPLVPATLT